MQRNTNVWTWLAASWIARTKGVYITTVEYNVVIPGRVYCDLLIVKRNICPIAAENKKQWWDSSVHKKLEMRHKSKHSHKR